MIYFVKDLIWMEWKAQRLFNLNNLKELNSMVMFLPKLNKSTYKGNKNGVISSMKKCFERDLKLTN